MRRWWRVDQGQFASQQTLQIENSASWIKAKTKNVWRQMLSDEDGARGRSGPESLLPCMCSSAQFQCSWSCAQARRGRSSACSSAELRGMWWNTNPPSAFSCRNVLFRPVSPRCKTQVCQHSCLHVFSAFFFPEKCLCAVFYNQCVSVLACLCANIQLCSHYSRTE